MYFVAFVVLEVVSAVAIGSFLFDSPDLDSGLLKFASRYGGGLIVSLLITGIELGVWAVAS